MNGVAEKLREVFVSVFDRDFDDEAISVDTVEEWDSLSHIKLILEIERTFKIRVNPEAIATLYGAFDDIVAYLESQTG